jgi:ATP-dependent protease ClpP protease subunit
MAEKEVVNSFQKNSSRLLEFYLSGPIQEPEFYISWFDDIRNANPNDEVVIYINSPGGHLETAIQFLRVMSDSQAKITCSVEGSCMSAATIILLAADAYEITPHSLFMFHNYSSGMFGKGGEMYDQAVFERQWSKDFLNDVYQGFLTDTEIAQILDNKDIWLSAVQVGNRLTKMAEEAQAEKEAAEE